MPNPEPTENWRTVYDHAGLLVKALDTDAVVIYAENTPVIEMTRAEWNNINMALEGVKND